MGDQETLPYHYVTTDINHWYVVIKQGRVEKAKEMKKKLKKNLALWKKMKMSLSIYSF
ncbi:hypothetical protein U0534_05930 [Bacillus atrophaeus]|nr:hypothetical protein [Bacillus atrophaeus]WQP46577.1 hypothetical protein U0534_05930 [Bacillus atrophaeus]